MKLSIPTPSPGPSRRGNYAIILVLTLPVLLGAAALSVDLTLQKVVRAELQAVADIAAAAGTPYLDGTSQGLADAEAAAIRAAGRNSAYGATVALDPADIEFGYWDDEDWYFVVSADPEEIDAMRLMVQRADIVASFAETTPPPPIIQHRTMAAQAHSTAQQQPPMPAGAVACYIPLAVPECLFDLYTPEELQEVTLRLNPAGIDNAGWGRIAGSPNASWTREQIGDCYQDGWARVGDDVGLQNGVVTSAMNELADAIEASETTWDEEAWGPMPSRDSKSAVKASDYGNTFEGPLLVFDGGDDYCEGNGGGFNGTEELVGFVWAVIYDVRTKGSASSKNIWLRMDPMAEEYFGTEPGGEIEGGVVVEGAARVVE